MNVRSQRARIIIAILSVLILISMVLTGVVATVGASPREDVAISAEVGDTTTTQPEDHRVFGRSLTRPNEGMEPQDPGDPGGWLQSSLFFIVCGAVVLLAIGVSLQARGIRDRRRAAGLDPLDLARASGEGVRAPSPLDKGPKDKDLEDRGSEGGDPDDKGSRKGSPEAAEPR